MLVNINRKPYRIAVDHEASKTLLVVSHERSGTHFLMNSIAMNSPYTVDPFLNFDHETLAHEVNFFSALSVGNFFEGLSQMKVPGGPLFLKSIIKSHHSHDFLEPVLGRSDIRVLYVHRDPVDTMVSLWRFLHRWDWHEGPQTNTPLELARRVPEGRLVRYQFRSAPTFFDRWAQHVSGWRQVAAQHENVMCVSYADLCAAYTEQICAVLAFIGQPAPAVVRPPPRESYIRGTQRPLSSTDRTALLFHIEEALARYPRLGDHRRPSHRVPSIP